MESGYFGSASEAKLYQSSPSVYITIEEPTSKDLFGDIFDDVFDIVLSDKTMNTLSEDFAAEPQIDQLVKDINSEFQMLESVSPPWSDMPTPANALHQEMSYLNYVPEPQLSGACSMPQTQQQTGVCEMPQIQQQTGAYAMTQIQQQTGAYGTQHQIGEYPYPQHHQTGALMVPQTKQQARALARRQSEAVIPQQNRNVGYRMHPYQQQYNYVMQQPRDVMMNPQHQQQSFIMFEEQVPIQEQDNNQVLQPIDLSITKSHVVEVVDEQPIFHTHQTTVYQVMDESGSNLLFEMKVPKIKKSLTASYRLTPPDATKRSRTTITAEQKVILQDVFNRIKLPSTRQREELAEQIGLCPRQVQIWFQNARRTYKLEIGAPKDKRGRKPKAPESEVVYQS